MQIHASRQRRLDWDFEQFENPKFETQWATYSKRAKLLLPVSKKVWLDVGAGTGHFFSELAKQRRDTNFIAIERDRHRGKAIERKAERLGLENFHGIRGNVIPTVLHRLPVGEIDRIFILYPCPWPKIGDRKNRWYLHPFMKSMFSRLIAGGVMVWASDQKFYIEEAAYILKEKYKMVVRYCGPLQSREENILDQFPDGRTKFESAFLKASTPCYELIAEKR